MADKPTKTPVRDGSADAGDRGKGRIVLTSKDAPFVIFDSAPLAGYGFDGLCSITLAASRPIAFEADGTTVFDHVATGHLRGTLGAMLRLRDQINNLENLVNQKAAEALMSMPATPPTKMMQ